MCDRDYDYYYLNEYTKRVNAKIMLAMIQHRQIYVDFKVYKRIKERAK